MQDTQYNTQTRQLAQLQEALQMYNPTSRAFARRLFIAPIALILSLFPVQMPAQENLEPSKVTQDALLHVLAHEIGHAILREFDLPILGPEEDIADDFATLYIYLTWPERAEDIIEARAFHHLSDGDTAQMFSEYRSDEQRAGRSICLLYGQDPDRFASLAARHGLEGSEAAECRDFATEVARSWRRIIASYRMPEDARVTEVGLFVADTPITRSLIDTDFQDDAYVLLAGIDWHSRITLAIDDCDGSAGWQRNGRRIVICSAYIARFQKDLGG